MLDAVIPGLKVEGMTLGPKAASIDLRFLLYKGGALLDRRWGMKRLESGRLGPPQLDRLPVLELIHRHWQSVIRDKSMSNATLQGEWGALKRLVAFVDRTNGPLVLDNILRIYLEFAAHLRATTSLSEGAKYALTARLARLFGPIMGVSSERLQWRTKILKPSAGAVSGAKENLADTAEFIQSMLETIQQLSVEVIRGPLPVVLSYLKEDGQAAKYPIHCGNPFKPVDALSNRTASDRTRAEGRRARASQDTSNTKRAMLINLRLDAELLVFINQTSANLTQALQLTGGNFRYQTKGGYVYVRPWKRRAEHVVEFRIEKGYRPQFEAFLKWREAVFPGDSEGLTFPFVYNDGDLTFQRTSWGFKDSRRLCKTLNKPFVPASQHRKTVGNFTKRRASREVAAELLSNSKKTFKQHYEEPNHQQAVVELVSFWDIMEGMVRDAVGPGGCQKAEKGPVPEQLPDAQKGAPKPDCEGEAGCLFCPQNRDLRSFDHAWNLASIQHLNLMQFNSDRTGLSLKANHPSLVTAERAAAKLQAMAAEDKECSTWVEEARLRVQEGRYHPHYTHKFESLEGGA